MLIWSESDINLVAKATYRREKKKTRGTVDLLYWLMVNAAGFSVLMQQKMKLRSQREEKAAAARN